MPVYQSGWQTGAFSGPKIDKLGQKNTENKGKMAKKCSSDGSKMREF